jgi:hypothetical protein
LTSDKAPMPNANAHKLAQTKPASLRDPDLLCCIIVRDSRSLMYIYIYSIKFKFDQYNNAYFMSIYFYCDTLLKTYRYESLVFKTIVTNVKFHLRGR